MIRAPAQAHPNTAQPLLPAQCNHRWGRVQHPAQLSEHYYLGHSSRGGACLVRATADQQQPQQRDQPASQQQQQQQQAPSSGRRLLLAATAALAASPLASNPSPAAAAAAAGAAATASSSSETFMSVEGFAFDHPQDWVVAFDRSTTGSRSTGAVTVVGNFVSFDTVSVFRTEVPAGELAGGLTEDLGYRLAVLPQQSEGTTMRFQLLSSRLAPAPAGGSCGSAAYEYEYIVETCRGEIIEGLGGDIQCLGPQGQDLLTLRRHHVGRAVLVNGYLYALNASAPVDRWDSLKGTLSTIVGSFRC